MSGEGVAAAIHQRHEGGDSMTIAMAKPGNTSDTFLVHFFGGGLTDERYVVERFKAAPTATYVPGTARGRRRRTGAGLNA